MENRNTACKVTQLQITRLAHIPQHSFWISISVDIIIFRVFLTIAEYATVYQSGCNPKVVMVRQNSFRLVAVILNNFNPGGAERGVLLSIYTTTLPRQFPFNCYTINTMASRLITARCVPDIYLTEERLQLLFNGIRSPPAR